ncbi:hypothetical protein BGX34_007152 [Mortierella sp. NVP85]|nr:hypothetical protein BGX34_007152 [Mortierella sp. NVP85]
MKFTSVILTLSAVVAMAQAAPIGTSQLEGVTGAAGGLPAVGGLLNNLPAAGLKKRQLEGVTGAAGGLPARQLDSIPLVGGVLGGSGVGGNVNDTPLTKRQLDSIPLVGGVLGGSGVGGNVNDTPLTKRQLDSIPLVGGVLGGSGVGGNVNDTPLTKRQLDSIPLVGGVLGGSGVGGNVNDTPLAKRDLPVPHAESIKALTDIVDVSKENLVESIKDVLHADLAVSVKLELQVAVNVAVDVACDHLLKAANVNIAINTLIDHATGVAPTLLDLAEVELAEIIVLAVKIAIGVDVNVNVGLNSIHDAGVQNIVSETLSKVPEPFKSLAENPLA